MLLTIMFMRTNRVEQEMARILFYTPFNQRSRDTESLMIAFKRKGHDVISLSVAQGLEIHPFLKGFGIETYSYLVSNGPQWLMHLKHIVHLIQFASRHHVQ